MIDILKTFTHLQSVARPSGFESPCAQAIAELAGPYCDEVKIDTLGNVICHKKGPGKRLMMAAHMDVIGLIITHIDKKGFLRFGALGGFVPYRLIGARMKLENGMGGSVWCDEKAMEEKKLEDITLNDLYLDIGAESEESARKMVQVGDVAMYEGEVQQLGQMVLSPYCDDLIACAALLSAMSQVEKSENDLYFVFTVQEEVGLRGAATAAYAIDPDFGVCMDVTFLLAILFKNAYPVYRLLEGLSNLLHLDFPQFTEKFLEKRRAFFLKDSFGQLHLMIESRHIKKIQDRTGTSGFRIPTSDHDSWNPCLYNGSGTHLTWFQRYI